jgi:hypothetical protein
MLNQDLFRFAARQGRYTAWAQRRFALPYRPRGAPALLGFVLGRTNLTAVYIAAAQAVACGGAMLQSEAPLSPAAGHCPSGIWTPAT